MITQQQREALQCVLAEVDDGRWREGCLTARAIDTVRAMLDTQKMPDTVESVSVGEIQGILYEHVFDAGKRDTATEIATPVAERWSKVGYLDGTTERADVVFARGYKAGKDEMKTEIEQLRTWKEEAEKVLQLVSEEHQNTDEIECSFWSDINAQYRGLGGTWTEEDCTCHVLPLRRFREKNK